MKGQKDRFFLAWAGLLDLGFEAALANLKRKYPHKVALETLKKSLLCQSERHLEDLYRTFKKLSLREAKKH